MREPDARISVALVDDQPLFLAGIRMLIDSQKDMAFCWQAGDGREAVELSSEQRPDVMLMDLRMPVMDGVEATRRIVAAADGAGTEPPRIIALTTFNRDRPWCRLSRPAPAGICSRALNQSSFWPPSGQCILAIP